MYRNCASGVLAALGLGGGQVPPDAFFDTDQVGDAALDAQGSSVMDDARASENPDGTARLVAAWASE